MEYVVDKSFGWHGQITPKVEAVMRMFGVDVDRLAEASPRHHCRVKLCAGQIACITGPSGSGKSVLLRELMAACVGAVREPSSSDDELLSVGAGFKPAQCPEGASLAPCGNRGSSLKERDNAIDLDSIDLCNDRAVIDCIDGNFIDALRTLSIAGLSDVFAVLNKPAHLSEGQKYRFRLAKALASSCRVDSLPVHADQQPKIIFADEFCSNLDRITAAVIAYQIRKFASRHNVAFVLASSHEDILADLRPDVVIVKQLNGKAEVIYKKNS